MSAYPTITPPISLDAALAPIVELSEAEFDHLVRATSSPRAFSLSAKGLKELKANVPSIANNLPFLLGGLSFLYSRIDGLGDHPDSFESVVAKIVDELEFESSERDRKKLFQARLQTLLRKNTGYGRFQKIQRLQEGFMPNAVSFRTMVDLRPDFGDGDTITYNGLLRIIQFRIVTDSNNPLERELVFQLNEESLADLSKAIDRAQKKLAALKTEQKLAPQFIEIE